MLDAESTVFSAALQAVRDKYPKAKGYNEETDSPATFPCFTLVESSNISYRNSMTADNIENHVDLMFTANTYSNLATGAKRQCKEMMDIIDEVMRSFGFVRTMNEQMPNHERSISRRTARWRGILGKDGFIYKN